MSQFKLVSVHSLGQNAVWHNLWGSYHHGMVSQFTEDYFMQLFWHFMRYPRVLRPVAEIGRGVRPLWCGGGHQLGESFLLSCHLLYYQDWLLCFMTYYYSQGEPLAGSGRASSAGLHNFLWLYHAYHGDVALC